MRDPLAPRPPYKLISDSLREVSVLVLVFGVLDSLGSGEALAISVSTFLGAVVVERLRFIR